MNIVIMNSGVTQIKSVFHTGKSFNIISTQS